MSTRTERAEAWTASEQRATAAEWRAAAELEFSLLMELIAQMEPKPSGSWLFVGESV